MIEKFGEVLRLLRSNFGRMEASSAPYVHYLLKRRKYTGILIDKSMRKKPKKKVRTHKVLADVTESVSEVPSASFRRQH